MEIKGKVVQTNLTTNSVKELFKETIQEGENLNANNTSIISTSSQEAEDALVDIEIDENLESSENTEDDKNLIETGLEYAGRMNDITKNSFTECEDFGDWINKQNFISGTVMSQGFDVEKMEDITSNYDVIRDSKEAGPQVIESSLSEEEQKVAREYAISLLEKQLDENAQNLPDYGDVRRYYNEGSLMDWVLSHPVSFALDHIAEKAGWEGYTNFSQNIMGKDGMFTVFNIPTYIKDATKGTDGEVRDDHWTDALGNIKTEEDLINAVAQKQDLINQLKESTDDPEKFAELYWKATDGVNFSADDIMEYKNSVDEQIANGVPEDQIEDPSVTLIGRNYIAEDIQKNEMMTEITYETNKNVGTMLCKMIPVVGPVVAGVVNVGVTVLEEKTQKDNELTAGDWAKIILKEGFGRYFIVNGVGKIVSKIFNGKSGVASNAASSLATEGVKNSNDAIGDAIDGNWAGVAGDAINGTVNWKAAIKTAFKTFFGLFKKG